MKKFKIGILTLMATLFAALGLAGRASATGRAISISPLNQQIVLIPGETYTGGFSVVNPADADSDLNYVVSIGSYSRMATDNSVDDYGDFDFDTKNDTNSIMDWTTLSNSTGTIAPNGQSTVYYTITVPDDAPAGGQYMSLLVREDIGKQELAEGSAGVNEVMQMAFVVYAEVAGETVQAAEILENNIPSILFNNKLEATSMVKNNGNVHTFAKYTLQVWPMGSNEEICTNEEEPDSEFVMPGTKKYHVESCDMPLVGLFTAKQTVTIFGETSEIEKMVIVCPIWLLFIVIFAVVALILWLIVMAKNRKNRR